MIYDSTNKLELAQFKKRAEYLINKGRYIELIEKKERKSMSQLRYIHVIFNIIAMEYGLTSEESKYIIKDRLGESYEKKGITFQKSLADYSKEDLMVFIDKIITKFATEGIYIPSPEDHAAMMQIELEIEKHKKYL